MMYFIFYINHRTDVWLENECGRSIVAYTYWYTTVINIVKGFLLGSIIMYW